MALNKAKILAAADKQIAKGNYQKALNELSKIAKETPNDTNLLNKMGDLCGKLGRKDEATTYFLKVADSHKRGGFNLKAIAVLKKITRLNPNSLEARERMVDLYLQQGHLSEAKGELRRMAHQFYNDNLFSRALQYFERLVEVDPNNLDARLKITEILVREGKREEAAGHFQAMASDLLDKNMVNEAHKMVSQGLKVDQDSTPLQILMARILMAEGKSEEALHQLTEICRRDDRNLDAIKILGETYRDRGQLREAKACFLRTLHLSSDEFGLLEDLAQRFIERGELDEAHSALVPVSRVFLGRQRFDEAIRLFRNILYVDDSHPPSQESLVEIFQEAGQSSNAVLSLEKLIHHALGHNDNEKAAEYIRALLEIDPNNLEWRSRLDSLRSGTTHELHEDSEAFGVHDFDHTDSGPAAEEAPRSSDVKTRIANHLTEAEVFMKYGIHDQAQSHLEDVLALDPFNKDANLKLKQLFFEKDEIDLGVARLVALVNGCIKRKDFAEAKGYVDEIQEHRPEMGKQQRGRLDTLMSGGVDPMAPRRPAPAEDDPLSFGAASSNDVVDFSKEASDVSGTSWTLELPADEVVPEGKPESLEEMFRPESSSADKPLPEPEPEQDPETDIHQFDFPAEDMLSSAEEEEMADITEITGGSFDEIEEITEITEIKAPPDDVEELDEDDLEEIEDPIAEAPEPPPPAPAPSPVAASTGEQRSLQSELEEIDFFISVEAYEDARNLLEDAQNHFGEHPLIMERMQEVEAHTDQSAPQKVAISSGNVDDSGSGLLDKDADSGFFDLAAELSEELFDEQVADVNDKTGQEEIQSVEELFEEFKRGVDEQISEDDHETHYDLGIAYKEMGLLNEAVSEFKRAMSDRSRFLECATLIGSCLTEAGQLEEVTAHFEDALARNDLSEDETLAFRYELAIGYQNLGDTEKALANFMEVRSINPGYRDLESHIEALV